MEGQRATAIDATSMRATFDATYMNNANKPHGHIYHISQQPQVESWVERMGSDAAQAHDP